MKTVEKGVGLVALELGMDTVLEERIARGRLQGHDALVGIARHLDVAHALRVDDHVDHRTTLGSQVVQPRKIGLVEDQHRRLVREEPLGRMEELALCLDGVSALLRKIDEVENANQVCERRDTLHLNVVHLLQGVVEDTRRIDHLPPHVTVVEVLHEERLGRERIRLDVDVRAGDLPRR